VDNGHRLYIHYIYQYRPEHNYKVIAILLLQINKNIYNFYFINFYCLISLLSSSVAVLPSGNAASSPI